MPSLPVVSAEGVRLRLADGRELIDGMASWWCAIHGYRHPALDDGRARAARAHGARDVRRADARARGAARASGSSSSRPPGSSACSSPTPGRSSVEVAIKIALQYQRARGRTGQHAAADRARRLPRRHVRRDGGVRPGRRHAPHVRRRAARSTSSPSARPTASRPALDPALGAARCGRWSPQHADELAAVIVEPVVQGAGGMRFHSPECVRLLRELCDEHGLLLDPRRDRDRVRAHRRAVRVRARGRRART